MNKYYAADIILEFLKKERKPNVFFDYEEIQKNLFPSDDPNTIHNLLEWIADFSTIPPLIMYKEFYVAGTIHIDFFLESGGFSKVYDDIVTQQITAKEKEEIEIKKAKTDLELAEKSLKDYKWTKWMSRIAFFISLGLAVLELIKWFKQQQ